MTYLITFLRDVHADLRSARRTLTHALDAAADALGW